MSDNKNRDNFQDFQRDFQEQFNRFTKPRSRTTGDKTTRGDTSRANYREYVDEVRVNGENLVREVEKIMRESNVRRVRIKQNGRIVFDLPVSWAALTALLAPPLAGLAVIAAAMGECTIEVTRVDTSTVTEDTTTKKSASIPIEDDSDEIFEDAPPSGSGTSRGDDISFR